MINDEIFGPGISPKHLKIGDELLCEKWPLLYVLSRLQVNNRPYYFRPTDALAPQRKGTLYIAGVTLTYELPEKLAGLPSVSLDFANCLSVP